jgi:hypothetical protein
MTESLNHKLDVSKIKTLTDVKNVFECMCLYSNVSEDNEQYELHKEYFTIPYETPEIKLELPRKSLEEISQECEEKFDKLIEDTKTKFYGCKIHAESRYERAFDKIFDDFEYAKKHGQFPLKFTLDYSKLTATGSNITSNFVFKEGVKEVGYYTFGSGYFRYYMDKKPNFINRWFMKNCLSFRWVDV